MQFPEIQSKAREEKDGKWILGLAGKRPAPL